MSVRETIIKLLVAAVVGASAGTAAALPISVKQFWKDRPVLAQLTSTKSRAELELCIGMQTDRLGFPLVLRGDKETVMNFADGSNVWAGVRILDRGTQRLLTTAATGTHDASKRITEGVNGCT